MFGEFFFPLGDKIVLIAMLGKHRTIYEPYFKYQITKNELVKPQLHMILVNMTEGQSFDLSIKIHDEPFRTYTIVAKKFFKPINLMCRLSKEIKERLAGKPPWNGKYSLYIMENICN